MFCLPTKSASLSSKRAATCAPSKSGPAGSRPVIRCKCFSSAPAKPDTVRLKRLRSSKFYFKTYHSHEHQVKSRLCELFQTASCLSCSVLLTRTPAVYRLIACWQQREHNWESRIKSLISTFLMIIWSKRLLTLEERRLSPNLCTLRSILPQPLTPLSSHQSIHADNCFRNRAQSPASKRPLDFRISHKLSMDRKLFCSKALSSCPFFDSMALALLLSLSRLTVNKAKFRGMRTERADCRI